MLETFAKFIELSVDFIWSQLLVVAAYPADPGQRIYWLYIVCSAIAAVYVFRLKTRSRADRRRSFGEFVAFLFPKEVWQTSSAWLDVRYFFFHQIFRLVIYGVFLAGALGFVFSTVTGGAEMVNASALTMESGIADIAISTVYMIILIAVVDLASYGVHYLQHKSPILWAFHRVHHSANVMHPLTNYREHPVDNFAYAIGTGSVYGLVFGVASNQLGYVPSMPVLLGVPLVVLAFNVLGYNLRHSHIWLRWPGRWSMVFASPAHHHIHHSCHPDQIDKNFAFIFPVWDVLFGTYHLPETNKDVRFGLAGSGGEDFKTCLGIYFVPFRNVLAGIFNRSAK